MKSAITLIDFEHAAPDVERWIVAFDLPQEPSVESSFVIELNWASSGPGIDWPEAYFVSRDGSHTCWTLWARNADDPFLVERESYPVARYESDAPAETAARDLLVAYWTVMRDQYEQGPFELVMRFGILDQPTTQSMATQVWGESAGTIYELPPSSLLRRVDPGADGRPT